MKNCTYVLRFLLICVFTSIGILPVFSQQIEKGLNSSTGDYLGFLEYKPTDYNQTTTKYPLIIFLHGIGERGNGTTMLRDVECCGIPRIIKLGHKMKFTWNGKTEQFLVISPQCPEKYGMWPAVFIKELINYAKTNLRVDPNRIYLTGLSMGGGGTFRFLSTAEGDVTQISAAAPICTPCTFSSPNYALQNNLPIWAFHAADDPTASVTCTYNAINRLNEVNLNPAPLMTIWPTGGHIVWDRVYTDTSYKYDGVLNIYEWFLGQNKTLPVNKLPVARVGNTINITTGTATAALDGSASTDADGHLVRYVWRKISGPAAGIITTAFGPNSKTTVTGLTTAGTYKYQLNVVDDRAGVSRDTLTVVVSDGASVPNEPPVAKAGNDANITLPTNSVNLSGSASTDPDGSISTYLWTKVSGPAATIASPNSATTAVNGMVAGTYVFKLKVTDNRGGSAEDQVTIVVNAAPNVAPVAKAGSDITITLPTNTVTLNGSTSTDSDGSITNYLWSKVSGPAATIANASGSSTAINNLVEGTYVFRLKVTDNKGASSEDDVRVTVNPKPNEAPNANAGADITITLPTNTATLNGGASSDPDGTISRYVWTKISGPAATIVNTGAASTAINGLVEGTYVFRLRVTDNSGAIADDEVTVTVRPDPNVAPVAKAGNDITITLPTNTVTLNGNGSTDSDGTISNYLWTKVSGPAATIVNASGVSTAVNNLTEGTYIFRLRVTDNKGATGEDLVTVRVNPAENVAPVANAGSDITITLPENKTSLSGVGSTDSDGTISTYEWAKLSGPSQFIIASPNASLTSVTNLVEGVYVFRLLVTDNKGATSADTVKVTVNAAPPPPNVIPLAQAGENQSITLPDNDVDLDGSASSDPDGSITSYTWSFVSGPSTYNLSNVNSAIANVTGLGVGTYLFKLEVKDNNGAVDADTVSIVVEEEATPPPPPNVAPVAKAGNDITITLPVNQVSLDGSASSDADGTITNHTWTKISGPESFNIVSPLTATTIIENLVEGTYEFGLLVKDNDGAIHEDTVKITVLPAPNAIPASAAGPDMEVQLPDPVIQLDGTGSFDPDGTITGYKWEQVNGPNTATIGSVAGSTTAITGVQEGVYTFRLTVTDNDGSRASDVVKITVLAAPIPNVTPASKAGADITITLPQTTVQLDGSASNDPDGTIIEYRWEKASGPGATIATPGSAITEITGLQEGIYKFRLTVVDDDGVQASDVVNVVVHGTPNRAPAVDPGNDIEITLPQSSVQLDGSASKDFDGTLIEYRWDFVSGPTRVNFDNQLGVTTNVDGLVEGVYAIRLTVTDDDGDRASDELTITVHPAPPVVDPPPVDTTVVIPPPVNILPVADAGDDQTISFPDSSSTINGGNSRDEDGSIAEYSWTMIEGPTAATIVNPSSPSTLINNLSTGEYTFVLTITDNKGAIAKDTVHISVINTQRFTEDFRVYPNPAVSNINVQLTSDTLGTARIAIYSASGTVVHVSNVEKVQPQLLKNVNIANLQTGLYYLEVIVAGKERKITKFIKKQ
ncbi:MAG: T9SS type A sorting domain-containing protein [Chitinophagaceae bacterium]|nr:T9SS type A sorting domain-containing protein [Chitinophagaceae bacterium]